MESPSKKYVPPGGIPTPIIRAQEGARKSSAGGIAYVVAVDFGTTRSGLSWTIVDEAVGQRGRQVNVSIDSKYASSLVEPKLGAAQKADTILVVAHNIRDTSKDQIGPAAFMRLSSDENDGSNGFYTTGFKMLLDIKTRNQHGERARADETKVTLRALRGEETRELSLLDVITRYLAVAGNLAFEEIRLTAEKRSIAVPKRSDITWVITVPAIWTDQARMFMRKAALKANLIQDVDKGEFSQNVRICLEPEGAALYSFYHYIGDHPNVDLRDKKFFVVDLGGGTADITVHQVTAFAPIVNLLTFDEMAPPSGGPWGGRLIADEFILTVLKPALGAHYGKFIKNDAIRLRFALDHFNSPIAVLTPEDCSPVSFDLGDMFEELGITEDLSANFAALNVGKPTEQHIVWQSRRYRLRIPALVVRSWFQTVLVPLTKQLDILKAQFPDVKLGFLVGGLGSNGYMYRVLKEHLVTIDLYQPQEAGLAIVRGAVRFGRDESAFGGRVARTNYGIALHNSKDPANSIFKRIVPKGEKLLEFSKKTQKEPLGPYSPVNETNTEISVQIFETDVNVEYVTERACAFVASILVPVNMSVPYNKRSYTISLDLSGTVLTGYITDTNSGEKYAIKWSSR